MSQIYYGIDLGTSNSSISYITESPRSAKSPFMEPTTVKFNPPPGQSSFHNWQRLPSIVYIARRGKAFRFVAGFLAEIEAGVLERRSIQLRPLGTFVVKKRRAKMGRNPFTNEPVPVPEHLTLTFRPSRRFKTKLNKKKPSQSSLF